MVTKQELLETEVRTVNKQLYDSYKHIGELNEQIAKLEKTIAHCEDTIMQLQSQDWTNGT